MTNRIPLIVNAGAAQIQEVSSSDVLTVPGTLTANVVKTDNYQYANGQPFAGGSGNASIGNLAVIGTIIVIDADAPETSIYISPSGESYAYF